MNPFESFLLEIGLSWTMSKIVPYLISILIGLIFVLILRKKKGKLKPLFSWIIGSTLFLLPFLLYFSFSPIYQGDFSNIYRVEHIEQIQKERTSNRLVVISIPYCPYCMGSIEKIKMVKERVPNCEIEYVVCTQDTTSLKWYRAETGNKAQVKQAKYPGFYRQLADGRFPTFAYISKDEIKIWSYDDFGVGALDMIESFCE